MVPEFLNIVILAGGAGTRLWPMSTNAQPKQFQRLVSDRTMLQETYDRVRFVAPAKIFVSTNKEYIDLVREQLPDLAPENIIAEPSRQDTGPCIGLAAALISQKDPEAVMAVVYADHLVQDTEEFQHKLTVAAQMAYEEKTMNIIEVKAKYPNVNLGYVKIGKRLEEREGVEVYQFEAFKEKPDYETAKRFVSSYSYLWNTGYYVCRVDTLLEEFKIHLPKTHQALVAIQSGGDIETLYPQCDKISIDYGVMEKMDPSRVRIIPADLGWSDIGTWSSLYDELRKEPQDNVIKGKVLNVGNEGSLVYNETTSVLAVMGVENLIVVQTAEGTLICPKDKSAHLKSLLEQLNEPQ